MVTPANWQQSIIHRRRYGRIETSAGRLVAIHFRPWPNLLAWPDIWPVGTNYHPRGPADRCWLYFNQPMRCPNYLALNYIATTRGTPYRTFLAALEMLDEVARLKRSDAILCDVANSRISDRLLTRLGWEAHAPQRWHRNYIKRFYGHYPPPHPLLAAESWPASCAEG